MAPIHLLLISPPSRGSYGLVEKAHEHRMPLGLAYITAYVERNGYRVKALDFDAERLYIDDLTGILERLRPDVVGFSCTTPLIANVIKMAAIAKRFDRDIVVIAGGPHATALPEETLKRSEIDVIVRGEGEQTTVEILDCLQNRRDLEGIEGLTYKSSSGIRRNPDRGLVRDIEQLPDPARNHFPLDHYRAPYYLNRTRAACANLIGSRGCPYRCIFCGQEAIFKHTVRSRKPSSIVDELEGLHRNHGIEIFFFEDSTFVLDNRTVRETCREILRRKLKVYWGAMGRVDRTDGELYRLMKAAGCIFIFYGVESGNQAILDRIRKRTTLDQIRQAVDIAKTSKIPVNTSFILGLPGENAETMRQTIDFAIELDPDYATFSLATPYPGTEFYRIALEEGHDLSDWDRYQLSRYGDPIYIPAGMTKEELIRLHKLAYRKFYLRGGYLLKSILKVNSFKDLVYKAQTAVSLLS